MGVWRRKGIGERRGFGGERWFGDERGLEVEGGLEKERISLLRKITPPCLSLQNVNTPMIDDKVRSVSDRSV